MKTFTKIRFEPDHDTTPMDDAGHGPWRKTRGRKRPGERAMLRDHHNRNLAYIYLYDVQAAQQQALAESWGLRPEHLATLPPSPTRRQIAAKAVELDFEYLRGFLDGTWSYVGVIVELFDGSQDEPVDEYSVWGVETLNDYHHQTAKELSDALIEAHLEKRRKEEIAAAAEAAERAYWACRDVATETV